MRTAKAICSEGATARESATTTCVLAGGTGTSYRGEEGRPRLEAGGRGSGAPL